MILWTWSLAQVSRGLAVLWGEEGAHEAHCSLSSFLSKENRASLEQSGLELGLRGLY